MILPADNYVVINKGIIADTDRKVIMDLYQPIIGNIACFLYYNLLNDLDKKEVISTNYSHHHIQSIMHISLEDFSVAKEKLEAVGLVKTYFKEDHINNYIYILYPPVSPNEFFNHPILNVVLYNNIGKDEYEKIINLYKVPRINLKDYNDISHSFDQVFKSVAVNSFVTSEDIRIRDKNVINMNHNFDFSLLEESMTENNISSKLLTKEMKELILNLSYIYIIDAVTMQDLIMSSLNEKGMIDKEILRKKARTYYQFENNNNLPTLIYKSQPEFLKKPVGDSSKRAKMIYTFENVSPYQFMKSKYKNGSITSRDLKIIEDLLIEQKLYPGVVNVLIDYVLKINNQKLNKAYIETIAGQWKRLGIESVEEAMNLCEKEYRKKNKTKTMKISREIKKSPEWFNQNIEMEALENKEKEELENILKDF